jgi:predicted RND superfamily exporter protein
MVSSAIPTDDAEAMPLVDRKIEAVLLPLTEKYPDYRIERTGITAIGRDEMDSVGPQTFLITLIALTIIFLMLVWNFRSTLTPVSACSPSKASKSLEPYARRSRRNGWWVMWMTFPFG